MTFIYYKDIFPIIISWFIFFLLAASHRILLPNQYGSFLQFKEEENTKKTVQSSSIRILYLIIGTLFLHLVLSFTKKQIIIGVFIVCFLNVWPAIIQNQLLKIRKNKTAWLLLIGYILFIIFSILITIITIDIFIPVLLGNSSIYWLDNQAITIITTLFMLIVPTLSLEAILSKFTRIVIVQNIDTFIEEVYILQNQLNMDQPMIEKNKYSINKVAKENDINIKLLETTLRLEIFYRGREYNIILEKIICNFFSKIARKKDISVGIAQIKISTAEKLLKEDYPKFIKKICSDEFNISLCGKLLNHLINNYKENSYISTDYEDIYDYIACEYLGTDSYQKNKTALIYSSVLRSFMNTKKLYYTGSKEITRYLIHIYKYDTQYLNLNIINKFLDDYARDITFQKERFIKNKLVELEFICHEYTYVENYREFADDYKLKFEILEI